LPNLAIISGAVGDQANLSDAASFTAPNYQTATLHFEYLINYTYRYPQDNIAVTTSFRLDGIELNRQALDEPAAITYSVPFTGVGDHNISFGAYSTIVGPAYSTLTGTLNVWLEYTEAGQPPDGTTPAPDYTLIAGVSIVGIAAAAAVYWFFFRRKRR
jgi:hypothetical protein